MRICFMLRILARGISMGKRWGFLFCFLAGVCLVLDQEAALGWVGSSGGGVFFFFFGTRALLQGR